MPVVIVFVSTVKYTILHKFTEKKEKNKVEEIQLANLASPGSLASKLQSGAWSAEVVDRALTRKLEKKLKHYRVLKSQRMEDKEKFTSGNARNVL